MARSFASGLIWGVVIVGGALGILSQLAPPPTGLPLVGPAETSPVQPGPSATGDAGPGTPAPADQPAAAKGPDASAAPTADAGNPSAAGIGAADPSTSDAGNADAGTGTANTGTVDAGNADSGAVDTGTAGSASSDTAATGAAVTEGTAPTDEGAQPEAPVGAPNANSDTLPDPAASQTGSEPTTDLPAINPPATAAPEAMAPEADAAKADAAKSGEHAAQSPTVPGAETVVPDVAPAVAPDELGAAPGLAPSPQAPAVDQPGPSLDALGAALTAPQADLQPDAAQVAAPEPIGPKDNLLVPGQGAGLAEPSRLPQIAATEDPGLAPAPLPHTALPAPGDAAPDLPQPLAPRILTPDTPSLPGTKGLTSTLPTVLTPAQPTPSVPGVQTNALPQIGVAPQPDGVAQPAPEDMPLTKFARNFEATDGKPLFAILLQDVGGAGMSRAELAKLPFPVTFVVDPLATDAQAAEQAYREAGQEVLMLANGLPVGATAGDVAETFQTLQSILPETVGVIDQSTLGFQDNRALASMVLPVIADQGRGLVTYDRGLNAADQIARRDGLPAAVVFRRLDGAGESQPTIRRYLDRAAFKAAQVGAVVVLGDTRADTVAAILQWTIEGKASNLALAPITAVMGRK